MTEPGFKDKQAAQITPEAVGNLFINERGELIDAKLQLFSNPEQSDTWNDFAAKYLPVDVYTEFGMLNTEGSEEWLNVVEHNVFVAAAAMTIGEALKKNGAVVDTGKLVRAAIIHDVSKRLDIEKRLSREDEVNDRDFESLVRGFGYTEDEIASAKNTGRLPDRDIQDPFERARAITSHSIEANIIGYADARSRGSRLVSLDEAMTDSIFTKPKDEDFFVNNWRPYYGAVESYLQAIAPGFDPSTVTDEHIFATVREMTQTSNQST